MGDGTETIVQEGIEKVGTDGAAPAAATPAAEPAAATSVAAFPEDDVLARLEADQRAADEANEKARKEAEGATTPAAEPTPGTTATPAAPAAPAAAPAAPKVDKKDTAIIALRRQAGEERAERLRLEGENRVLKSLATGSLSPEQRERLGLESEEVETLTPQQQLAAIDQKIVELAEQYDNGKLTTADWKKQELALMDQRSSLMAPASTAAPVNDTALETHLTTLLDEYPILNLLSKEQLDPFIDRAYAQAEAEGKPIPETNLGTIDLRTRMARLAHAHYMPIITKASGGAAPAARTAAPAAPGGAPALSATAQAREAKLTAAANHPPNISNTGAAAPGGDMTDEAMLNQLAQFGGDDDAAIRFLGANKQFAEKIMRGVLN